MTGKMGRGEGKGAHLGRRKDSEGTSTSDTSRSQEETSAAAFGSLLKQHRRNAWLTQEELAVRSGLSVRTIRGLERGEGHSPRPDTVNLLGRALNLSGEDHHLLVVAARRRGVITAAAASPSPSLPSSTTPIVGREEELTEVKSLVGRWETRLLTLTGTGGVGKTRLAIQAARELANLFPDGVVFVALASLGDPALVIPTVARTLGLRESEGQTTREALHAYLHAKRLLLVLDNFEHLLGAAPEVVDLIESSPQLFALVTSRATLRVRGEQEYLIPPLKLPRSTRSLAAEEVAGSPAGRLFLERARAASPAFALDEGNAAQVATICWQLAGLPLALELAAARVKFLSPSSLLARLDRALSVDGARDLPQRQRTLRATLDWSHALLSEPEKALFRRLSVFADDFTLEAAEAVGAAGEVNADDVLELVGNLVEQSLIVAEGGVRYGMLEPVRQYALEKLKESREAEKARTRHAAYFLALAERAEPELWKPDQLEWLDLLESESDNLRAALSWTVERGHGEVGLRLSVALQRFWSVRGYLEEGRRWLETALSACPSPEPSIRAQALHGIGRMALEQGYRTLADRVLQESLALRRSLGDKVGMAASLQGLAEVALWERHYEPATLLCRESVALRREIDDKQGLATSLNISGLVETHRGDHERALALHEEGLTVARQAGDTWAVGVHLDNLGWATLGQGDHERAARLFGEALKLNSELGEKWLSADCLDGLARVASAQGSPVRAARLWGAAKASSEAIGALAAPLDQTAYDRHVTAARAQLDEAAFDTAWAEGRNLPFEEAVAYALADDQTSLATP